MPCLSGFQPCRIGPAERVLRACLFDCAPVPQSSPGTDKGNSFVECNDEKEHLRASGRPAPLLTYGREWLLCRVETPPASQDPTPGSRHLRLGRRASSAASSADACASAASYASSAARVRQTGRVRHTRYCG